MSLDFSKVLSFFHVKIYKVVEDPSSDPIISWGKGNNSFVIWNLEEFNRSGILHEFFCTKFSKFRSDLNFYGFRRIKKGSSGEYEFGHEDFVRGQPERLRIMILKTCEKRYAKAAARKAAKDLERLQI